MTIEFTQEQLNYVNSSIEEHVYLEACPGSGKTEVVAAKVAKEIDSWKKYPSGLAALSFANSATDELSSRVARYQPNCRSMFPHFLGTFDSFIFKNIVSPISTELTTYIGENGDSSIRIVEPNAQIGYKTKYSYVNIGKIKANHYSIDPIKNSVIFDTGEKELNRTLNSTKLENWQIQDLIATKNKMLENGFATYRDIQYLAITAITQAKYQYFLTLLVKRYPLIIIDECQDLSEEQLIILQVLANNGSKLHFIGDLHQSIYSFREVEPRKVEKFVLDNNFEKLQLSRNFRSCQNIVNLCSNLTGRKNTIGNVTWLDPRCLVLQYNNCPTELIETFKKYCEQFKNSVVLSRGHSTLQKFHTTAEKLNNIQKLALAIKLYNPKDMEYLDQSLRLFSEFLQYHLNESNKPNSYNCPHSIDSNLLWRRFLYKSLNFLITNGLHKLDVEWSIWTKSAKKLIRDIPLQSFCDENIASTLSQLKNINLTSPSGSSKLKVTLSLGESTSSLLPYKKTTIHGAKGESHDVTIVISSVRSGGDSHWKDWLKDCNSEAARFAYVASSRPKEFLIWAVKTLKPPERKLLEDIGFTII